MSQIAMMPCDHVIARLWEYIDQETAAEESDRIRAHLEMCARCFPQYQFQQAYKVFIRRTAHQPVPASVRRRVFETILAEESGRSLGEGLRAPPLERLTAALGRLFRGRSP